MLVMLRNRSQSSPHLRAATAHGRKAVRRARVAQILQRQLSRPLPLAESRMSTLVGLLTSEFGLSGLLVACRRVRRAIHTTMARRLDEPSKTLGYSGGGRPGLAPGSLYVGPPTGAADYQRTTQKCELIKQRQDCQRPLDGHPDVEASELAVTDGLREVCSDGPHAGWPFRLCRVEYYAHSTGRPRRLQSDKAAVIAGQLQNPISGGTSPWQLKSSMTTHTRTSTRTHTLTSTGTQMAWCIPTPISTPIRTNTHITTSTLQAKSRYTSTSTRLKNCTQV